MTVKDELFTRAFRPISCFILFGWLTLGVSHGGFGQSMRLEQHIPAAGVQKIIISNADQISVDRWDKDEVMLIALASLEILVEKDIRAKRSARSLEISSQPSNRRNHILLIVRVPKATLVQIRKDSQEVEAGEATGSISAEFTEGEIDLYLTRGVGFRMQYFPPPSNGMPFVKVRTSPQTSLRVFTLLAVSRQYSAAAETVARQNGVMGRALRQSEPLLARSIAERSADPKAREDDGADVKLQGELVNLSVSVTDRDDRAIGQLKQDNFTVYEDGVEQVITHFSSDEAPFNLVLLLDSSSSEKGSAEIIKSAALHFLDVIQPQDKVAVVTFNTDVQVISHLTSDRDSLRKSISDMQLPSGGTSFYDALGYVLAGEFSQVKGQRNAVVALTDGVDNSIGALPLSNQDNAAYTAWGLQRRGSYLAYDQLLDGVFEAGALIYAIQVNQDFGSTLIPPTNGGQVTPMVPFVAPQVLQTAKDRLHELASASGGRYYDANNLDAIKGVYDQVAADLRTVYSIAYAPSNQTHDGKFRRISVQVKRPDIAVRMRRGYYADK